ADLFCCIHIPTTIINGERVPFSCIRDRSDEEGEDKAVLARAMRDEGKTLQQIADALGYNNASSIHYLLNKH
ncbi:MAG: hypothetical protein J6U48_05525, partial [Alistipes sp.]|nr:hypothetical protein [Alistipes sp.]